MYIILYIISYNTYIISFCGHWDINDSQAWLLEILFSYRFCIKKLACNEETLYSHTIITILLLHLRSHFLLARVAG